MIEFEHVYKSYSDTKAVLTDVFEDRDRGTVYPDRFKRMRKNDAAENN